MNIFGFVADGEGDLREEVICWGREKVVGGGGGAVQMPNNSPTDGTAILVKNELGKGGD